MSHRRVRKIGFEAGFNEHLRKGGFCFGDGLSLVLGIADSVDRVIDFAEIGINQSPIVVRDLVEQFPVSSLNSLVPPCAGKTTCSDKVQKRARDPSAPQPVWQLSERSLLRRNQAPHRVLSLSVSFDSRRDSTFPSSMRNFACASVNGRSAVGVRTKPFFCRVFIAVHYYAVM